MTIHSRLTQIVQQVRSAEQHYARQADVVKILAVSKTRTVAEIKQAIAAGQRLFGENYLQEAIPKVNALMGEGVQWHFIGTVQTKKAKAISQYFDWVHSIDRLSIAQRLNDYCAAEGVVLNVCLQVNLDEEITKSGVQLADLAMLAQQVKPLSNLTLRGLMAIPKARVTWAEQRATFHRLSSAYLALNQEGFHLDTLSMGMSGDFVAAIAEGATILRLGTAIFGPRQL